MNVVDGSMRVDVGVRAMWMIDNTIVKPVNVLEYDIEESMYYVEDGTGNQVWIDEDRIYDTEKNAIYVLLVNFNKRLITAKGGQETFIKWIDRLETRLKEIL